ncbi:fibrous sheath-interacting protein 2-like isoform X2 [Paroedura picta]|uniref:fibrous sheath-interacting protein 2-like isoform X2 n=1 Tax=Paroedura picta TaxID=143630 RepID=UPI004055AB76
MAYPHRGLAKASMGHYLTESARTALEAMEPEEGVVQLGPGQQMPAVGPNQLLDMPLFSKTPFLPGSNTLFYTTKVGEKLYQPSPSFDLNDPYCKVMAPKYNSLHDPHLRAFYKRKSNLQRLKKSGFVTDKNKVVCSLKEFNEYRQYLTSLKMEFEKHYIKEQKMIEKQVTKIQDSRLLPEAADTSKYRDWLLKEERPTIEEQENVMRNRYLDLINEELSKLEQLAEENRYLVLAHDDKKKQGLEKRKQFLLRKKMEEEWRKKEMLLLMKIGDDIKREARIEEERQKIKEEKLKRKQFILEKKMAYHLKKLQERFLKEGFPPPDEIFPTQENSERAQNIRKTVSIYKRLPEDDEAQVLEESSSEIMTKDFEFPKGDSHPFSSQELLLSKSQSSTLYSVASLKDQPVSKNTLSQSKETLEPETSLHDSERSRKESLEMESVHESDPHIAGSKVSYASAKEIFSTTSEGGRNPRPADFDSGGPEGSKGKVTPSASLKSISDVGAAMACGGPAGCGSKTSCGGPAGCGSKTSCGGPAGCGSKTSCGGPAGCGSKTSCGGPAGCGSKTSCGGPAGCGSKTSCGGPAGCGSKSFCCGSGGCGSKTSCCGAKGCGSKTSVCGVTGCGSKTSVCGVTGCGSKTSVCGATGCSRKTCCGAGGCGSKTSCSGSVGCCSSKDKSSCSGSPRCCCGSSKCTSCGCCGCGSSSGKGNPSYDSSGSSRPGASCTGSKCPFSSTGGENPPYGTAAKASTRTSRSSRKAGGGGYSKTKKKKKREMSGDEPEVQAKERRSSKKRRTEKSKAGHTNSSKGFESSYSAYAQYLLSNISQSEIQEVLKGKVSVSELNSIIQNVMTWVVSAVTTILYPALTKFEERVKTQVYTVSEDSVLSSDNSSSCSTCNEDLCNIYGSLPCASTRKVSFTDTSIKPTTSLSDFQTTSGKHTSVLSSNSASFKSTHTSWDNDPFQRKFTSGKAAIFMSPSKYSGLLSTMTSVKSSKSDSQLSQFPKYPVRPPETESTSCHSKRRHMLPAMLKKKGVLPKAENATELEGMPFGGRAQKPPKVNADLIGSVAFKDLRSIFADLKSYLTQVAAILLEDVFKQILKDLGLTASSLSITTEVLLESISESLLGSRPADVSPSGSVSRISSFMATDIVDNVLDKLQAAAQRTYVDILSKNNFAAGCKATCIVVSGKNSVPDPTFWRARIPLSFDSVWGIAEEMVVMIREKLNVFSTSSQTKLYQLELCAKIKDIGKPLEQIYTAVPPHNVESEAANLIVKETIRKIVSKTVASSETNILQYVEEMISRVLSFIQRQMSHEGLLPIRESSIILQLINDVFNSLSTEKLKGISLPVKSRASPEMQEHLAGQEARPAVTTTTLYTAEKGMRKPFSPVNVPGMVIDAEVEGTAGIELNEMASPDAKDQKVSITTVAQGRATYESRNLESRERSQAGAKSAPESGAGSLEEEEKAKSIKFEKTGNHPDIFVQDVFFSSVQGEERVGFPAEEMPNAGQPAKTTSWTLYQVLKKIEIEFKDEEQPLLLATVRELLDDVFQHIWAVWPIWPPAPPPPSLAHVDIQQHPQEEQPASKRQTQFHGQPPISDSDVSNFTGELVKTLFQKLSCATLADAEGPNSKQHSLLNTEKEASEAGKGLPAVHFVDPGMASEPGTQEGEPQAATDEVTKSMSNVPLKLNLANDLVETILGKLEAFVTSKVEFQFCSDVHNLKTSTSSDFSSHIDQDMRKLLETQFGSLTTNIKDILHFVNHSILEVKEKAENMPLLPNFDLKTYAQKVARVILQNLKHGLDQEMEKIATPPIIFSESIAASQIVNLVLDIFSPQEHQSELQYPAAQEEGTLEKLLRKNPNYKRDLRAQIQNTVESILNEIYQMIMFNRSHLPPSSQDAETFSTCGIGEFPVPKIAADATRKPISKSAVPKCDVSVVSDKVVDIVLEDLCPALAVSMSMKGSLSDRLQPLVYDFVQKAVEPLVQLSNREVKADLGGHLVDFEKGSHQIPGSRNRSPFADKKLSDLKEVSPEGLMKSLVDNIFLRLASFAEEKLASEWIQAAQCEKQSTAKGKSSVATPGLQSPTPLGTRENEVGCHYQKAKLAVQDSQTNIRLCAEKLTFTILQLIKKDFQGEALSSPNTLPYKENASAHEMLNQLLAVLSDQIAFTENEVQKRVLKKIFRTHLLGQKGIFPLSARVEEVLNQITQRIVGDLGHLPSLNNDSIFPSSEPKASTYHGGMETASQVQVGRVASEIVDSVLHKMYSIITDTLFSSSDSKLDLDSSGIHKGTALMDDSHFRGVSDTKKMASSKSNRQPQLQPLAEELVQNILNKIACFVTTNLEEILPGSAQQKWKPHWTFQCNMQAGDGAVCRPRTFSEEPEGSPTSLSLTKLDLTIYAKDIVSKVLGTIMDAFRTEDFQRTILRINTLSSHQISIVNDLLYSVVQELHKDDVHLCHFHKHPALRSFRLDDLHWTESHFHPESPKAKCKFHDEFRSYLKEVLPKEGILKHIFEQQPLTEANIIENFKMLQGMENIVREVFMRIHDLEPSVWLLKRTPGELSEKLFCFNLKRSETLGFPHSNSQAEIGSVARDIVANVFESVQKCLAHSVPCTPEQIIFPERKDQATSKGSPRIGKHRIAQPKLHFCTASLKASMDAIDRMAKETIDCVVLILETFVTRHFRREFKCNFMEIVKFPLESLSFAQATRSLHSLSTQVGSGRETFGTAGIRSFSTLGPSRSVLDFSKWSSTITKECVEAAFREVQMLHSELNVYANNAVSSILETIKWILDKQLSQKEATLFSSSSDSLVLSETLSVMLDRCTESLTEVTSELMVENLQLEMAGQGFVRDKTTAQNQVAFPGMKKASTRYRKIEVSDSCPPIQGPAKVIYLEEGEIKEEIPSQHPSKSHFSECDIHTVAERHKGLSCCASVARARATKHHGPDKDPTKSKFSFLGDDWLPRQKPILKGSILEKLFSRTEEPGAISKAAGQTEEVGVVHHEPLPNSRPLMVPENTCYPATCPVKLTHAANMIVNTILSEFGLENEPVVQASCIEKLKSLCPLKEKPPTRTCLSSVFEEPKPAKQTVFSRWERRLTDSGEKTNTSTEESLLLMRDGSTLLSKWESTQPLSKSPKKHKKMELLACTHMPEPREIQMLADHIVLCVIKELIKVTTQEPSKEKDHGTSLLPWKQKLWKPIWRSTYLPSSQESASCLDLLWEPLTQAVISKILSSISNVRPRQNAQERNDNNENTVSMFCSVDSYCPEHGLTGSKTPPLNIEELANRVSTLIMGVLCERNLLQEPAKWKGLLVGKAKYIYIPPPCLADFDDVYHPLVKAVANVLTLEIDRRGNYETDGNSRDFLPHPHFSSPHFSRNAQIDDKDPSDVGGTMCLPTAGLISHKNQRLSCIASNLDRFIHHLKNEESKDVVNKVLHIIFDSLLPAQAQGNFAGPFLDDHCQNMMSYREAQLLAKQQRFCSSICPPACRLTNSIASGNLGLSPKSILLLDVVSEKLIRALLEKCLMTDKFTQAFAFDEFPEDEQICDVRNHETDHAVVLHSRQGMKAHQVDSSASICTYEIKYSEEPWVEDQSGASSYESALDMLAHTLVKPVLTELSLSIEQPRNLDAFSRKSVGFKQPASRKPHVQYARYGKSETYSSMPRGRKQEPRMPVPGRHLPRKNAREKNRSLLESTLQHSTFGYRAATPTGKLCARKPFTASYIKKSYGRETGRVRSHPDPSQFHPKFSMIYSATFLEEIMVQLLVRIYASLRPKYEDVSCVNMQEMNLLFVNALVGEFKKAGVGLLPRGEQKTLFPPVDSRTINKLVDSILREFGFQLAAEKGTVRDIDSMAERAAEIILVEILDYQLPPSVCKRLPRSAYKSIKAGKVIQRIEQHISFSTAPKPKQPPPPYITILSQKYLERVINQLVAQFLPPSDGADPKQDKWEISQAEFDDLCSYMINQVMRSIAKHKIWVAKKDDRCNLHSEKEIQSMVDSVYTKMLKKSGSQSLMQKEVTCRSTNLVDNLTSFIIQEISQHHLQTFAPKDQAPYSSPDTEALSKNIVKTVLDSICKPSVYSAGVFPAKQLEEIVNRVLTKIFQGSGDKMKMDTASHEVNVGEIAKRLANSINVQFGRSMVTGPQKGEEQSLVAPLMDVMDDIVNSVCLNIAREQEQVPHEVLGPPRDGAALDTIKSWIEKGISDYLLHPLFSGDFLMNPRSSPVCTGNTGKEFGDIQEENENRSPFNTFLSSGFLKDMITGLLSKIFPSTSAGDHVFPQDEKPPLDSDTRELSTQLLDDIRINLLKHQIKVIQNTHPEQSVFTEEDIHNMAESLSRNILQKAGSMEAIQRDMKNKNGSLIEQIVGFLIGDILKQHLQPFLSQEASPARQTDATGEPMSRFNIYRTVVKPLDQDTRDASSPSILKEIISGLFSKIAGTLSDIPLPDSGDDLGAVMLAKSLSQKLATAQFNSQEVPEEKLGFPREDGMHTSPQDVTTLSYEEAAGYQLSTGGPSNLSEMKCFIQKNLFGGTLDCKVKPLVPYMTVFSYQILEAIIDRLLGLIFPSSSSTSAGSAQEEESSGPDFYNRIAQIKKDIMATVSTQAIWISSYGNESETRVSGEAMKNMVESLYCDLLHEVLFQQPLPTDRESLNNFYVTKIACFVMNEMFKYHLQSSAAEETSSSPGCHLTVFPYSLLEVLLAQLLEKIFTAPESTGKQIDFSEANFTEMAANLKSCVITEISAHEIRLENIPERIPDLDQENKEDIANSIYSQLLQKQPSQHELQNSLLSQGNAIILRVASLLTREILNHHLCPFLSGNDSTKSNFAKWQGKMELRPHGIHSMAFLEDIVVAFFCQILSSPNFRVYSKDRHLSEEKMRHRVTEQVNALVLAFQLSNVKVIHCAEGCSYFPQVTAEKVIQISNAIYQKLLEKSGSELEIFKALENKSRSLAEQLTPLMLQESSGYRFQPLLTGDTSPYLFSFLQADTIIDRVEALLPDSTYSSTNLEDKFLKIIHRIFPLWAPGGVDVTEEPDPTVGGLDTRNDFTKHRKEDSVAKPLLTEEEAGVHSSDFLKDIFHRLISKLFPSSTQTCMTEEKGPDSESLLKDLVESILKEFEESQVKVLQGSGECHDSPMGSEKCMQVWQHDDEAEELDSEARGALGEVVDCVRAGILKYSSSEEASLNDDLMSPNEEPVDRLSCYMMRAVPRGDFEPGSESEDDLPYSTSTINLESDTIIQKFLSDIDLMEQNNESSDTLVPVVSVLFLEEILSRFLTKVLLLPHDVASAEHKMLSKAEVNDIAHQLKTSVERHISKNKINLVFEKRHTWHPKYEETVDQVVHSVLEKSGSKQELYNDMRNAKVIFPDKVASIIVNEISSYSISNPYHENVENETRSALELDRIVSKVVARMGHHVDPDEELSIDMMMDLQDMEEESLEDGFLDSEDIPVKIVPYLGDKPLNVDPNLVSEHLAVLAIKTEPLEKLNKRCLSRTGVSLTELRKASLSNKSVFKNVEQPHEYKRKERRSSLDFGGHLDVRPREVPSTTPAGHKEETPKEATGDPGLSKTPSTISRKRSLSLSKCCPALTLSSSSTEAAIRKKSEFPPENVSQITTSTRTSGRRLSLMPPERSDSDMIRRKIAAETSSILELNNRKTGTPMAADGPPPSSAEKEPEEESLEKAVVDVHLSRDTEETPGPPEITSVYQDQNIHKSLSSEEKEEDQANAGTDPETVVVSHQQSSKFEKISNALSKVFSRTSANAAAGQEEPPGDEA